MILATWNIRSGNPLDHAARLRAWRSADVIALQECRQPAPLDRDVAWAGSMGHKGLAVVTRDGLNAPPWPGVHTHDCLPVDVDAAVAFVFVGTWTHTRPAQTYPECLRDALRSHLPLLAGRDVVVAGDFNSHPAFDHKTRRFTHADLMRWLHNELGLVSAWHAVTGEPIGHESQSTHYHLSKQDAAFHLDYVCIPERWVAAVTSVEIGNYADWTSSDHRPVVVELDDRVLAEACGRATGGVPR